MSAEMDAMRQRLIDRFEKLPDRPGPGETMDELHTRAGIAVWLIGWCEDHGDATREQYMAEVDRVKREGPRWGHGKPAVQKQAG